MYEYIAEFERWKKTNKDYLDKYSSVEQFVSNCIKKSSEVSQLSGVNSKNNAEIQSRIDLCKKPIIDIERFNVYMIKRLSTDVYDLCSSKTQLDYDSNITSEINKMKICTDNLFRENEITVKKETLQRLDDMIKFFNV